MEKQFKDKDPLMMELVKEAGLERPGPDFAKAIMDKLEPKTATAVYSPLISKKAWWVIAIIAIAVLAFLFMVPMGALPWGGKLLDGLAFEASARRKKRWASYSHVYPTPPWI